MTGKHRVVLTHSISGVDSGYLAWSGTLTSLGLPDCPADDALRSHFGAPFGALGSPRDMTVFTQRAFSIPGGGTDTLYLNSEMPLGTDSAPDTVGDDYVVIEFHANPPTP